MYSDHHSLSGEVAERMARCANVTQRMETASERKAYRDSVDKAKQERSLAAQAKQKASDPVKGPCSPSSPTNAKKRRTTSIDKPAIGAPLSSASSSSRASAAADEECLVMSGAELQKVYRSLARADWTVASTRILMDRMSNVMANEKESINRAKNTIPNILKRMGRPPSTSRLRPAVSAAWAQRSDVVAKSRKPSDKWAMCRGERCTHRVSIERHRLWLGILLLLL